MNKNDILNLVKELVEKTSVLVNEVSLSDEDGSRALWFRLEVDEPHLFLGRGGEGLSALNHLVRRIVESKQGAEEPLEVLVDINGFQRKRIENVRAIAHMMAERARYFKSNIEVDPMPPFERRIVHEFLSSATDLKTESEGQGHSRRVVIKYIGELS